MKHEPAFPCNSPDGVDSYSGMTLRDYFAGQALIGQLASGPVISATKAVEISYQFAGAMLLERSKEPK